MADQIIFRRGTSEELKTFVSKDADSLIFIEDQNILYKTTGVNKPLARYSDVQSGYINLSDLEGKVIDPVHGKLYLTADSKIYYYDNNEWKSISATADLSQVNATIEKIEDDIVALDAKVEVLESEVASMSDNVDTAITDSSSAITKADNNATEITTLKGKVSTSETDIATIKTDVDAIEVTLTTLQSSEGKIKVDSSDTSEYLEDKINTDTLQIKDNKLLVKSIDGMTVGTAELNQLSGVESNIQVQLNTLDSKITSAVSGVSYIGRFDTKSDLEAYNNPSNGMLAVVENIGLNDSSELYIYDESSTTWDSIGKFEFSDDFIELHDTPSTYEEDMFLKSDGSQIIYSKVKYSELEDKPTSEVAKIDQAVTNSHTHTNKAVLDKFTEDTSGNVLYDNKELSNSSTWEVFEF